MENGFCLDNCLHHPVNLTNIDIQNLDWINITNGFGYIGVNNVINALGTTNEEKREIIENLCKVACDNNIILEPLVFELMEERYVFYGGTKESFGVIARMKTINNFKEKKTGNINEKSYIGGMTKEELIKYKENIERIQGLKLYMIYKMSPSSLGRLTDDFADPLVRLIFAKTTDVDEQRKLVNFLGDALYEFGIYSYDNEHYFDDLRYEIDCNRIVTLNGIEPASNLDNNPPTAKNQISRIMTPWLSNKTNESSATVTTSELENSIDFIDISKDTVDSWFEDNKEQESNPVNNKRIAELEARIKELEEDNCNLRKQLQDLSKDKEIERLVLEKEAILVELLTPIFKDRVTAKSFAEEVNGQDDIEIMNILSRYVKEGKASKTSVRRKLWSILHAFKIYDAEESNWNFTLNNRI